MCATCGCGQKNKSHPMYGKGKKGMKHEKNESAKERFMEYGKKKVAKKVAKKPVKRGK